MLETFPQFLRAHKQMTENPKYDYEQYAHRIAEDNREKLHLGWSECSWQEYWFDKDGKYVLQKDRTLLPKEVEFIVLPHGEVLSVSHPEWGIVSFIEPSTNTPEPAAAKPTEFALKQGNLHVKLSWIKDDADFGPKKRINMRNLFLGEDSWLPLSSFDGNLRHFQTVDLPSYRRTFPVFRRWLNKNHHAEIGYWTAKETKSPSFVGIDVYDALEFYFIHPITSVWRTRIGELLWTIVEPYVKNVSVIEDLIGAGHWRPELTCENGDCQFCGKLSCSLIAIKKKNKTMLVDSQCIHYAHGFHRLGRFMRKLRSKRRFSPKFIEKISIFLESMHDTFF